MASSGFDDAMHLLMQSIGPESVAKRKSIESMAVTPFIGVRSC